METQSVYIVFCDKDILGVFDSRIKADNFKEAYIENQDMEAWREDFKIGRYTLQ